MTIGLLALAVAIWNRSSNTPKNEGHVFTTSKIVAQEPLILDGNVETAKEQLYYIDAQKGQVSKIYVTEGQEVAVGDALFEYDNEAIADELSDMQRQISRLVSEREQLYQELEKQQERKTRAAQVTVLQPQVEDHYEQTTSVSASPVVNTEAFDQAIEATQKAIRDMNNTIEDMNTKIDRLRKKTSSVVNAEIAGTVTIHQDAQANMQQPLIKITSKDSVIRSSVSEYDYEALSKGEVVSVYVKAQDREIAGTLDFISTDPLGAGSMVSASTPNSSLVAGGNGSSVSRYAVTITPSETLPNGFTVQVKIPQKDLVVVEQAVQKEGEQEYLYLYKEGKAVRQNIKRVKKGFQWIVTEGVQLDDVVIVNPDDTIKDGSEITVKDSRSGEKTHD